MFCGNDGGLKEEKTIHVHGLGIEELAFAMIYIPNSLGHVQDLHCQPDIERLIWSSDC